MGSGRIGVGRKSGTAASLERVLEGVRCSPAETPCAGSSSRTWNTPPVVSTLDPTHHPCHERAPDRRIREIERDRVVEHARVPEGAIAQLSAPQCSSNQAAI